MSLDWEFKMLSAINNLNISVKDMVCFQKLYEITSEDSFKQIHLCGWM